VKRLAITLALLLLAGAAIVAQVADQIAENLPFGVAVDYVNDPNSPASALVLFQDGKQVTTAAAPNQGTVTFEYPQGLPKGLYNFRIVARNTSNIESAEPNPTLALTVGDYTPPPPPPPPQGSAIEFETSSCVWIVKTASTPDGTTGWSIQFREDLAGGTFKNLGSADSTAPYRRSTGTMSGGSHIISGVWKKSGKANVVLPSVTRVCQ